MNDLFSLNDKVAIVTGGAGYLGSAMSEALASYGARVYIASRNQEKNQSFINELISKNPLYNMDTLLLDVTDSDSVKRAIQSIIAKEGKIDILINNAYSGRTGDLLTMEEKDWIDSFDGSIHSTYRMIKEVLPYMLQNKYGKIINISSMYGLVSPNPEIYGDSLQNNPPQYGSAKAAIVQFTRYIAGHFGNKGINANCIAPGPFPDLLTQKNTKFIKKLERKNPMKRIGTPEDIKGVTLLLASKASDYINGQTISVDGGWTIW